MSSAVSPVPPSRTAPLPGPPPRVLVLLFAVLLAVPVCTALLILGEELTLMRGLGLCAGLLAFAGIALQFISSGRFESVSGKAGLDRTMMVHRIAGGVLLLLVIAHPLLLAAPDPGDSWRALPGTLGAMMSMKPLRTGVLALAVLGVLIFWALQRRRDRYERWRVVHLLLALASLALVLHHAHAVGSLSGGVLEPFWWLLVGAAALSVLWVHGLRPLRLARQPWTVVRNTPVAQGIFLLELQASGWPEASGLPAPLVPAPFLPGQFGWLSTGRWPRVFADHPFSIASAPQDLPRLELLIKERGDGTRSLAALRAGSRAFLDYPHGNFTPRARSWDRLLLVAGGIGVAPMRSILLALAIEGERRPITLVYGANRAADFALRAEFAQLQQRLALDLFYFVDAPEDVSEQARLAPRADMLPTLLKLVRAAGHDKLLVMLCGPAAMPKALVPALRAAGVPRSAIVYERFAV